MPVVQSICPRLSSIPLRRVCLSKFDLLTGSIPLFCPKNGRPRPCAFRFHSPDADRMQTTPPQSVWPLRNEYPPQYAKRSLLFERGLLPGSAFFGSHEANVRQSAKTEPETRMRPFGRSIPNPYRDFVAGLEPLNAQKLAARAIVTVCRARLFANNARQGGGRTAHSSAQAKSKPEQGGFAPA